MEDQSTASLVAVTTLAVAMALATFCGCKTTTKKAVIETACPNVWSEKPTQSIALKLELSL